MSKSFSVLLFLTNNNIEFRAETTRSTENKIQKIKKIKKNTNIKNIDDVRMNQTKIKTKTISPIVIRSTS